MGDGQWWNPANDTPVGVTLAETCAFLQLARLQLAHLSLTHRQLDGDVELATWIVALADMHAAMRKRAERELPPLG